MLKTRSPRWMAIAGALFIALAPGASFSQTKEAAPSGSVEQAVEHFVAGQKLYDDGKFEDALVEFRASFAASPSPNSHLYIARCIRQLGRSAAAHDEYALVIVEAAERAATESKYEATLKAATEERAALREKIATLTVTLPDGVQGAVIRIDNDRVVPGRWKQTFAVDPGHAVLRVEAPGHESFERELNLSAGGAEDVTVALPAGSGNSGGDGASTGGSAPKGSLRTAAYVSGAVGVVGFALFGIFSATAASKYDDLQGKCAARCPPQYQDDVDAGRSQTAVSHVGLGAGIVGIAGGVGLFIADLTTRGPEKQGALPRPSIAVRVAPDPAAPGLTILGRF